MPNLWSRRAIVPAVLSLALLTGACNDDSPTEPSLPDSVAIESIVPGTSTVLRQGTQVTITVTARYSLGSTSEGRLVLVIEDQTSQNIAGAQPDVRVPRGQGTAVLSDTFTIPASATRVTVFVPLVPQGATQTSVVATATYNVTS